MLNFERFEIETATWKHVMTVGCEVESVKFSSGAFEDAFHATIVHGDKWVKDTQPEPLHEADANACSGRAPGQKNLAEIWGVFQM